MGMANLLAPSLLFIRLTRLVAGVRGTETPYYYFCAIFSRMVASVLRPLMFVEALSPC